MERKFNEGDVVYERIRPSHKLIVRRYTTNIYYCLVPEFPERKDLVFFERELMPPQQDKAWSNLKG